MFWSKENSVAHLLVVIFLRGLHIVFSARYILHGLGHFNISLYAVSDQSKHYLLLFWFSETNFFVALESVLELSLYTSLPLNSKRSTCPSLPCTGIKSVYQQCLVKLYFLWLSEYICSVYSFLNVHNYLSLNIFIKDIN